MSVFCDFWPINQNGATQVKSSPKAAAPSKQQKSSGKQQKPKPNTGRPGCHASVCSAPSPFVSLRVPDNKSNFDLVCTVFEAQPRFPYKTPALHTYLRRIMPLCMH